FHLCHTHDTFYYRRRAPEAEAVAPTVEGDDIPWYDRVRRSAERIDSLIDGRTPLPPPTVARSGSADHGQGVAGGLDLLRRERFAGAAEPLRGLPQAAADPDAQLLLAVLATNGGRFREAEEVCARLLELDELHGGAHYLMALARDHEGDPVGAAQHDRAAIY